MNRPEWLASMPADEYHAATKRNEFTTSHRLNLFRKCPALYKKTIDGLIVEGDTAAFQFGRATHTLILEGPDKFDAEFSVCDGPVNEKTGKRLDGHRHKIEIGELRDITDGRPRANLHAVATRQ